MYHRKTSLTLLPSIGIARLLVRRPELCGCRKISMRNLNSLDSTGLGQTLCLKRRRKKEKEEEEEEMKKKKEEEEEMKKKEEEKTKKDEETKTKKKERRTRRRMMKTKTKTTIQTKGSICLPITWEAWIRRRS